MGNQAKLDRLPDEEAEGGEAATMIPESSIGLGEGQGSISSSPLIGLCLRALCR